MPRWVGGLRYEEDRPLEEAPAEAKVVRLAYNQAEKVRDHGGQVYYVLDRTDLGGPRRLARRWYRWYATVDDVLKSEPTPAMLERVRDWQYTSTAREALERERVRRLQAWGKLKW